MSRGLGRTQRRLLAALQAEPTRLFTIETLAETAFPGEEIDHSRLNNVRRALERLPAHRFRQRNATRGWHWGFRYEVVNAPAELSKWCS
jgi:hypothetical protein